MKKLIVLAALVLVAVPFGVCQSSDSHTLTMVVNSIALLNHVGGNITLTVTAPAIGGQAPQNGTDSAGYLQYTSTVPASQTRRISVAWGSSDVAPAGCSLSVTAIPSGGLNQGATAGPVAISNVAANVVTTIGSCYTGTGGTNGANLTYVLSVDTATSLVAGDSRNATVTYTLTDAS